MTGEQLTQLGFDVSWLEPLQTTFDKYKIDTPQRQACFIGQCAYESANFTALEENLHYRADTLIRVWPTHFTYAMALECAQNPEKVANIAYADRMGNGNAASGDGWKYHGRGLIQLTGKNAYAACGTALGVDLLTDPDIAKTPDMACLTAGWFWDSRGLNALSDSEGYEQMTKRINGGTLGLGSRIALIEKAIKVIT